MRGERCVRFASPTTDLHLQWWAYKVDIGNRTSTAPKKESKKKKLNQRHESKQSRKYTNREIKQNKTKQKKKKKVCLFFVFFADQKIASNMFCVLSEF